MPIISNVSRQSNNKRKIHFSICNTHFRHPTFKRKCTMPCANVLNDAKPSIVQSILAALDRDKTGESNAQERGVSMGQAASPPLSFSLRW